MSQFDDFLQVVLTNGKDLAKTMVQGFEANAQADIQAFLASERATLKTWSEQAAKGELSKAEFEDLVLGEADLAKLAALTQAGIAVAQLERLRVGLMKIVVDAAFDTFWPA